MLRRQRGQGQMASKIDLVLDQTSPQRLSKADLDAELMLLHTTAVKIGQRHTALMKEWDRRQIEAALADIVTAQKPTPKVK